MEGKDKRNSICKAKVDSMTFDRGLKKIKNNAKQNAGERGGKPEATGFFTINFRFGEK